MATPPCPTNPISHLPAVRSHHAMFEILLFDPFLFSFGPAGCPSNWLPSRGGADVPCFCWVYGMGCGDGRLRKGIPKHPTSICPNYGIYISCATESPLKSPNGEITYPSLLLEYTSKLGERRIGKCKGGGVVVESRIRPGSFVDRKRIGR